MSEITALTPDQLANLVCMLRSDIDGALLLTDDLDDSLFYERCVHRDARVITCWNTARALLNVVRSRGVSGVLAAVHEHEVGDDTNLDVVQPSRGDTVSILLDAPSSEAALEGIAGTAWIRACRKEAGDPLRRAVSIAWVLAQLRERDGQMGPPGELSDLVDAAAFAICPLKVQDRTCEGTASQIPELTAETDGLATGAMLELASGQEAVTILAMVLAGYSPRGLRSEHGPGPGELIHLLRLAYELSDLERDLVYWEMRMWELRNQPFRLLKRWRQLDPLQMLLDQRYWEDDLKVFVEEGDWFPDGVSVLMLDLDNFKSVNEQLGHKKGDEAIKLACDVLRKVTAGRAETYRRGGDELVAIAPGIRGEKAADLAEQVRSSIESSFAIWRQENATSVPVTASVGLVDVDPGSDVEEAKRLLDEAQRSAKRSGKNRVVVLCCPALGP